MNPDSLTNPTGTTTMKQQTTIAAAIAKAFTNTTIAAAAAATVTLGGCAYFRTEPPAIQINYEAANADATGLIRAFDTKGNTVLQFFDVAKARPTIYGDGQAAPLKFEIVGQQLAVLPGTFQTVRIEANGATATVTRQGEPAEAKKAAQTTAPAAVATGPAAAVTVATAPAAAETASAPAVLGELAAARRELEVSNTELNAVRGELAKQGTTTTAAEVAATHAKLDRIEQRMADAAKVILRVSFDFNSAAFDPTPETKAKLLADANAASLINVRGRTDSPTADEPNFKIALARAIAARDYLVKNGVDSSKIRVFSLAAGAFVAKNDTEQGRRLNRRVEIEMLGKEAARLAMLADAAASRVN